MLKVITISILLTTLLLAISFPIHSQELVSAGGDYFENAECSISFSIGELVTDYYIEDSFMLTQGFQQSAIPIVTTNNELTEGILLSAYPNPTSDYIEISTGYQESMEYQLLSFKGKLLEKGDITSSEPRVYLSYYKPAIYLLRLFKNGVHLSNFKIIKQ